MKKILTICIAVLLLLPILPCFAAAEGTAEQETWIRHEIIFPPKVQSMVNKAVREVRSMDESSRVDLSGENLDSIYNLLIDYPFIYAGGISDTPYLTVAQKGFTIPKESITPEYQVSYIKYCDIDQIQVIPRFVLGEQYYVAKVLDENQNYVCNVNFSLNDGKLVNVSYVESDEISDTKDISNCYVDHANRIKELLGADELISPDDVRLVAGELVEKCFYIKNENYDIFISVTGERIYTKESIRAGFDRQIEHYIQNEEKRQQMISEGKIGENDYLMTDRADPFGYRGMDINNATAISGKVDNIVDIAGFIHANFPKAPVDPVDPVDPSDPGEVTVKPQTESWKFVVVLSAALIGLGAIVTGCLVLLKKKARNS